MAGKKQHYVPQFLLRNFAVDGSEQSVAAYRFGEGRHLPGTKIRNQAHENNFYGLA